jgi:hypothetical protein
MLHTQEKIKIATVHSIAWLSRYEDFVTTQLLQKVARRARTRLSIPFENFKISQLEQEIQIQGANHSTLTE